METDNDECKKESPGETHEEDTTPMLETCVQTFRGVTVSDQELREQDFKKGPRIYGGVEVSAEERAALDLPPNFSMYEKVDVNRTRIDM